MLRVKTVQVGGRSFKIGNLQFGPRRLYLERLRDLDAGRDPGVSLDQAKVDMLEASLKRADPEFRREQLDALDDDDILDLLGAVADWSFSRESGAPPGEPPSP